MLRRLSFLIFILFLTFAALIRFTDLHDQPLDFNPVRQLRSSIIARGIYYAHRTDLDPQKQGQAISFAKSMPLYEPPLLENLIAYGYQLTGGENIAIPRIVNTFFWLVASLVLFFIGRKMASEWAVLPGLAFFLFLPFSIYASRSFQPEAWMVMWVALAVYAFIQWNKTPTWKWTLLAGSLGGIAALVKIMAAFFLGPVALVAVLSLAGRTPLQNFKAALRNPQVWVMALLIILPSAWYYLFTIPQSSAEYVDTWTVSGAFAVILTPSFYFHWILILNNNFGLLVPFLGFIGAVIAPSADRKFLLALWAGYFIHGLYFPRQTPTHDYYHIMLLPIVALSLAPFVQRLVDQLVKRPWWVKTASVLVLFLVSSYGAWIARSELVGKSYADVPAYWQEISAAISSGRAVGYTQDVGLPIMYYGWRRIFPLPQKLTPEKFVSESTAGDYFVITDFDLVPPGLADYVATYYPLLAKGDGYAIYTLKP